MENNTKNTKKTGKKHSLQTKKKTKKPRIFDPTPDVLNKWGDEISREIDSTPKSTFQTQNSERMDKNAFQFFPATRK